MAEMVNTDLHKLELNDEEREQVKRNPLSVASELAWQTSEAIIMSIMRTGIPNGRLIAIEVDKALNKQHRYQEILASMPAKCAVIYRRPAEL